MHGALRPHAALGHGIAAVLRGDGLIVGGAPVGHVGLAQQSAIALAGGVAHFGVGVVGVDGVGDKAAIPAFQGGGDAADPITAGGMRFIQDARVRVGDGGRAKQRIGRGHAAIGQPDVSRRGPFIPKQRLHRQHRLRHARHQRKAVAGVVDGGTQHVGQLPRAVVAQQRQPGAERAGNRGGQQADAGHHFHAQRAECGGRGQRGRRALAAQRAHALFVLAPEQNGHFAAGAVQVRLHDL
ncbi:hypothetical protein D3C86_1079090 [compost metagenome]